MKETQMQTKEQKGEKRKKMPKNNARVIKKNKGNEEKQLSGVDCGHIMEVEIGCEENVTPDVTVVSVRDSLTSVGRTVRSRKKPVWATDYVMGT